MNHDYHDHYAVIGNPIEHSQSPSIHAYFAAQTAENITYTRVLAPIGCFTTTVHDFISRGGRGLNVTAPFKLEAYALAHTLSPRAAAAGSVNTLCVRDNSLYGDNTDGIGLVRDIEHHLGVALARSRILLLGAGGAARGVLLPLINARPTEIVIVNRTAARAAEVAQHGPFADAATSAGCRLIGGSSDIACGAFDIVINATTGSLNGSLPAFDPTVLTANTFAYDMMYGREPTVFMRYAQTCHAHTVDGLGMLVEQAAESFFIWRGVRPDSRPVLAAVRNSLAKQNPILQCLDNFLSL